MKIYFAGSIRGGRDDTELYQKIIGHLKNYGEVFTEHVGDKHLKLLGEDGLTDTKIHRRDLEWLLQSDAVVAEVSTPSLGVGYELGRAVEQGKSVLGLYRRQDGKRLSAMIAGCSSIRVREYQTLEEAKKHIDEFLNERDYR